MTKPMLFLFLLMGLTACGDQIPPEPCEQMIVKYYYYSTTPASGWRGPVIGQICVVTKPKVTP